jgi:peptidoglycan hydrolase CwlO-like protein
MTTETMTIGECECGTCGCTYDFESSGAECSDQCVECAAKEEAAARIEEEREEAIADAQSELEEAEADLDGALEEMKELRERIADVRKTVKAAQRKLARLGQEGA